MHRSILERQSRALSHDKPQNQEVIARKYLLIGFVIKTIEKSASKVIRFCFMGNPILTCMLSRIVLEEANQD